MSTNKFTKKLPYSEQAMRRIIANRNAGKVENVMFFCGEHGRQFIRDWDRCSALWMPPFEDARGFDYSWLRGFEVVLHGRGEWDQQQERGLALGLLDAGCSLVVSMRFDARGKWQGNTYYTGVDHV